MIYRFADCELDTDAFELRKAGGAQHVERQVFDVLAYLVKNHERVVGKDEILDKVRGDRFVSEAALNSRLMAARRAIGDNGKDQRLIRTLHRRGFRFVGRIEEDATEPPRVDDLELDDRAAEYGQAEQDIRFCRASDGVRIAYATVGRGPPLIKAPNWLSHLEYEWASPVWQHWWEALARDFKLIRFDQRGSGLSDREVDDLSLEAWISDLDAVVEACGEASFNLLGISQGGLAAVEYAILHPDRVRKLVLYGCYAQGRMLRGESRSMLEAQLTLMREGWGRNNPAYRQMFTTQFMPGATAEQMGWFNDLQRVSCSGETAARVREVTSYVNLLPRLQALSVPTLVIHARHDEAIPFDQGRLLASSIPNARLVTLDSHNHLTLKDEPAWSRLIAEVRTFLLE